MTLNIVFGLDAHSSRFPFQLLNTIRVKTIELLFGKHFGASLQFAMLISSVAATKN